MRDFLSRFRPAGAPGAGRAAVPADRRRERESELGPVLMLLDGPSAECSAIVAAAQRDAAEILDAARAEADRIRSAARQRATASVDEHVQAAVAAARTEAAQITAAGAAAAAAVAQRARLRLPSLANRAVGLVRDLGDDGSPS
jgi:cell division septum initiation protein DivIVA